jgi:DNA-binding transcriptional MerR regulator
MTALTIGELAKRTGSKVQTIRWYEQQGLLPAPARSQGNQRRYGRRHLERLAFIRHARELGFGLDAIRELLTLADAPDQSCARADAIAQAHLREVESRIARLEALKAELARMVAACAHGRVESCRVIEVLADHSHANCLAPSHGGRGTREREMP